jgi:predicted nucleic acid-binding protein
LTVVVDASFAVAFLLGEKSGVAMDNLLESIRKDQTIVYVPALFWYEIANVLITAERKGKLANNVEAFTAMQLLPFETDDVLNTTVWSRIVTLSKLHGLTAYDAAYLELAERKKVDQLKSFDQALLHSASAYPFGSAL